jgi:tetratricopeptide (TPR) repeat protein
LTNYSVHSKESVFAKADSLYNIQAYEMAALTYERIIYETTNDIVFAKAALKKAACYKKLHRYELIENQLKRVALDKLPDTLVHAIFYEMALSNYLNSDYVNAETNINQLNFFVKDSSLKKESLYLEILILNELREWEAAKKCFQQYLYNHALSESKADQLYPIKTLKLKNEKMAVRLSKLFPGIGQVYAGAFSEGLFSFVLNASFISLSMVNYLSGYYFTAGFIAFVPLPMFYSGGAAHAAFLVRKNNQLKIRIFNNTIKDYLLVNQKK